MRWGLGFRNKEFGFKIESFGLRVCGIFQVKIELERVAAKYWWGYVVGVLFGRP